jgi:hypothetical protein
MRFSKSQLWEKERKKQNCIMIFVDCGFIGEIKRLGKILSNDVSLETKSLIT